MLIIVFQGPFSRSLLTRGQETQTQCRCTGKSERLGVFAWNWDAGVSCCMQRSEMRVKQHPGGILHEADRSIRTPVSVSYHHTDLEINLLKFPVSVICRLSSMKSKRQRNRNGAFFHWRINRTECICSSGVSYHMELVISTQNAFNLVLSLQNDNKTEKMNIKLCCIHVLHSLPESGS